MMPGTLRGLAAVIGGTLRSASDPDRPVRGVAIDSRKVFEGDLFFALPGERRDGVEFVAEALARGAAAAVVPSAGAVPLPGRSVTGIAGEGMLPGGPLIEVDDPARALLDLARHERDQTTARVVVGITGSTGKTCTKDLTAAVLTRRFRVAASPASFNNEVGLPLTILLAPPGVEVIVCEMGARGPGHIRRLCEVARPHIGVVTNVGTAHMELFGSPKVLEDAKAELPESLPVDGTAVLNADDGVARSYATRTPARSVFYGNGEEAVIRARGVEIDRRTGKAGFELAVPDGVAPVILPVPGEHMVANALAAGAVGWVLGIPVEEIAAGLGEAVVSAGRMEVLDTPDGFRVVNDAYNANPTSMAAALKAARWMARAGRCLAVLGPMAELGPIADSEHERVGELVARLGIDGLIVVGQEARLIAVGAEREGVEPERITFCEDVGEAVEAARAAARPGDLVLVKASRVARLERVAEALVSPPEHDHEATA
jgi:UDP-N-acetylmuramoyl-tripeptide--D-alanyl-D-alanine ligase